MNLTAGYLLLWVLTIGVALYDVRFKVVPNAISLPLIALGLIVSFPGTAALWIGTIFILQAWMLRMLGGGDAKLWIGLAWCLSTVGGETILLLMFASLFVTGLLQLTLRLIIQKQVCPGVKAPGAWRTAVFAGCVVLLGVAGKL